MVVVMVVMMVVMRRVGEYRTRCKHHQQQGCGKNLFHGSNVAQSGRRGKGTQHPGIKRGTGARRSVKQRKLFVR
jgi:hypothetical protein